jgi:phage shock protein PspC (stress-responsive transcriptional regulator)
VRPAPLSMEKTLVKKSQQRKTAGLINGIKRIN